jgi:2-polyprenyl-6-methoxyphenol hydroxylase-like FAD-dependent oxidoreductase
VHKEATQLRQFDDHVSVTLCHEDGREEAVESAWVVGCEGGRSFVREQLKYPI